MFRVALVNMPFASLELPAFGLTQLRSVILTRMRSDVQVDICYLNHDFGQVLGASLYQSIALSGEHLYTGVGDWLFRPVAFPDASDNTAEYMRRFYPRRDDRSEEFRRAILSTQRNLDLILDDLIGHYRLGEADVVGLTTMFAQTAACIALARKLKTVRPAIVTVLGGANCEYPMGSVLARHLSCFDFVCSGPGLESFPYLIDRLRVGEYGGEAVQGMLPGKARRATVNESVAQPVSAGPDETAPKPSTGSNLGEERDINAPIDLDYDSFLADVARAFPTGDVNPVLLFETSRGCWWGQRAHCTFCGLNGSTMSFREMTSERALAQFTSLFRYASRCSEIRAVDNILPKSYLRSVLPHVHAPSGMKIFYEVKADLSDEDVQVLARASVRTVQPGIESLATSTLKLMRKGTSSFTNLRFLMSCDRNDVKPVWNLLLGFPGEGAEVYAKYFADIPRLTHLPPPTGAYPVRFDRFSPYFVKAVDYCLALRPLDFYSLVFPWDQSSLADLAYYFADTCYSAPYQVAMLTAIRAAQQIVEVWAQRYAGSDGAPAAALFTSDVEGRRVITDTRSGVTLTDVLSPIAMKLLDCLEIPVRVADLAVRARMTDSDVTQEFARLTAGGYVFSDGEHVMSVVMKEPPTRLVPTEHHPQVNNRF